MERKSFIYLDGRTVKHTYDENDVYFVASKGDIFYYLDIDNTTFAWYGQAWFEINKQEVIKYLLDDALILINHFANVSNKETINFHELIDAINILNNIKRRAADDFDWNND